MYHSKEIEIKSDLYKKSAIIYGDKSVSLKAVIFYLHGGGLLYGRKEDLPSRHIEALTGAGYLIIALDYPLAPAVKLPKIMQDIAHSINGYCKDCTVYLSDFTKHPDKKLPFFLWGRSSGAYLSLLLAAKGFLKEKPTGVLSYYGYGFLVDGWYQNESAYYKTLPQVPASCLNALPDKPHADGDLATHYSVYVYARQTGTWKDLIYEGRDKHFLLDYSLRVDEKLPCSLFAAHSTGDTDVPYQEFIALCNRYQPRRFIAPGKEHDFDRDSESEQTAKLLEATIAFLNAKIPAK